MIITVNTQNGQSIDIEIEEINHSSDNGNEYKYKGEYEIDKNEKYSVEAWRNRNEPFVYSDSVVKSDNITNTVEDIADQFNSQINDTF